MIMERFKQPAEIGTAIGAISTPLWWVDFSTLVNIWIPPLAALLGFTVLFLTIVEKIRSWKRSGKSECDPEFLAQREGEEM